MKQTVRFRYAREKEYHDATQHFVSAPWYFSHQTQYIVRALKINLFPLYIDSPGGEVGSGLALYDVMQAIQCPIRTVCANAASMAAILFAAGSQREILPHARIMIHDPLIAGGLGGSALQIDSIAQDLMKTRAITAEILARHTGHTIAEVYAKTATDTYFDATAAVAWGLADRIVTTL